MYIWKSTKLRCNPYNYYVDEQGTQYPKVPPDLYEEIPDPARGDDEIEYTQEINEAPYIVITPKSQEQLEKQHNANVKAQIAGIESSSTRALREAALGSPAFLIAIEAQIQGLRATLKPEPPKVMS